MRLNLADHGKEFIAYFRESSGNAKMKQTRQRASDFSPCKGSWGWGIRHWRLWGPGLPMDPLLCLIFFFFFSELGVGGWEKKRSLAFSPHPKVLPPPPACHSFQLPPPPKWLLQRR